LLCSDGAFINEGTIIQTTDLEGEIKTANPQHNGLSVDALCYVIYFNEVRKKWPT